MKGLSMNSSSSGSEIMLKESWPFDVSFSKTLQSFSRTSLPQMPIPLQKGNLDSLHNRCVEIKRGTMTTERKITKALIGHSLSAMNACSQ